VSRAGIAAVLLLCAAALAADNSAPDAKTRMLLEGQMPDEPARTLVQAKCLLCHSGEYVTQQRLTEGQWQKTVDKMRKFGTPANDDEAQAMVAYLARHWTPDLPASRPVRAPGPTRRK
jgi:hypothetical protein